MRQIQLPLVPYVAPTSTPPPPVGPTGLREYADPGRLRRWMERCEARSALETKRREEWMTATKTTERKDR